MEPRIDLNLALSSLGLAVGVLSLLIQLLGVCAAVIVTAFLAGIALGAWLNNTLRRRP